ncbi:MAG: hypothetical protein GY803_08565, partial [Chloroflexi bacterium]|nr:hypothetical protein [Chloroflexota bacterium]
MKRLGQTRFVVAWLFAALVVTALLGAEYCSTRASTISLGPEFSQPAGYYENDIWLEIGVSHPEAKVYFTVDGRIPDPTTAILYTQPILLSAAAPNVAVVRARAFLPDRTAGPVVSASYALNVDASLPMLSLIVEPEDFWGSERGIYVRHAGRGREWERPVDLTYIADDKRNSFHVGAGLRIHGGWSRSFFEKKSFRLYFRNDYGAAKLNYPLFGPDGQTAFDHLILHNSGMDLLLFKNQLIERLAGEMGGYIPRNQPALLFINGRPWGIYHIRERIDERFFAENYGIPGADISDTPNNRGQQSPEQLAVDTVHWEHLMAFILENELTSPENYAYLQTQMDLADFVDYYLLQMYSANTDWPHHNVHQFRPRTQGGRWQWIVWDNDFAFDLANRQMVAHVMAPDHPLGERMGIFLNKLLANPEFRNLFAVRLADLLNTSLAPAQATVQVERLAAKLEADIPSERARWAIDTEWETTAAHMLDFIQQRPEIMRRHMIESLGLSGTAQISFQVAAGESGWIVVNETEPQPLPWQGVYFVDSTIRLQVVSAPGFVFAGWEGLPEGATAVSDTIIWPVTGDAALTPRFSPTVAPDFQIGD